MAGKQLADRQLSAVMQQGAVLTAAGYTRKEIGAVLDVSPATLTRWNKDEEYQALIKKYEERHAENLAVLTDKVQVAIRSYALEAMETLSEAQKAASLDGNPKWATRLDAATAQLKQLSAVLGQDVRVRHEGSVDGKETPRTAVIVVQQGAGDPPVRAEAVVPPTIEAPGEEV